MSTTAFESDYWTISSARLGTTQICDACMGDVTGEVVLWHLPHLNDTDSELVFHPACAQKLGEVLLQMVKSPQNRS